MKDIYWGNSPDSNCEFRFQAAPPPPPEKPKPQEKPKVLAQSQLGGKKWDPNKSMPTGGAKDD